MAHASAKHMKTIGELGLATRRGRQATKKAMAASADPVAVLEEALDSPAWANASAADLVLAMSRWGNRRTHGALLRAGVGSFTTVGRLTERQKAALVAAVRDPNFSWTA